MMEAVVVNTTTTNALVNPILSSTEVAVSEIRPLDPQCGVTVRFDLFVVLDPEDHIVRHLTTATNRRQTPEAPHSASISPDA